MFKKILLNKVPYLFILGCLLFPLFNDLHPECTLDVHPVFERKKIKTGNVKNVPNDFLEVMLHSGDINQALIKTKQIYEHLPGYGNISGFLNIKQSWRDAKENLEGMFRLYSKDVLGENLVLVKVRFVSDDLTLEDFVKLSYSPLLIIGTPSKTIPADGARYDPKAFFIHDLAHNANMMENQIDIFLKPGTNGTTKRSLADAESRIMKRKIFLDSLLETINAHQNQDFKDTFHKIWFELTHELNIPQFADYSENSNAWSPKVWKDLKKKEILDVERGDPISGNLYSRLRNEIKIRSEDENDYGGKYDEKIFNEVIDTIANHFERNSNLLSEKE